MTYIEEMFEGYVEAAIWCATDAYGDPIELDTHDIPAGVMESMRDDVVAFFEANRETLLAHDPWKNDGGQAGHDFYLTREGHGAGFWDRNYGDTPEAQAGRVLTEAASVYGATDYFLEEYAA